ncbi:flagellar biosynthetic protein FliO [Pseudothauera rhizosphaerae]|uniref:Flagellar protein n=2 Tax=Pseudothauera rhizosphaerae TaxID=2565932 RepID=A0A4S4AYN9_9RHOO|nr:flagellar biosynthetic protein FliO [Pseudothauera rhizosphaerae]
MLFGLVVVIAILLATLWALKRLSGPRGAVGQLRVLGATSVGPRERVVLVELGKKVLVLGVGQGNVRTLHVMEADELPAAPSASEGRPDFSAWLRQSVERRRS